MLALPAQIDVIEIEELIELNERRTRSAPHRIECKKVPGAGAGRPLDSCDRCAVHAVDEHVDRTICSTGSLFHEVMLPENEVLVFLRSRSGYLSFHRMDREGEDEIVARGNPVQIYP